MPWLAERETPIVVALTKADKLAKNKRMLEVTRARKIARPDAAIRSRSRRSTARASSRCGGR